MSVQDNLIRLIRPAVEDLGYEFVGLEYLSNPKNRLVRIYIDREPEGISVDDCANVSHEVSALLDVEDPISGEYSLEVSSPGIERPLFEPAHYRQFVGERATVHLFAPLENRRKIKGVIVEADDARVILEADGQRLEVAYADIRRANLKPDVDALLSGR
ncbi:MAG: ribosome maturation factor RimP [Gammaproteobacteria bacterium HGW-Gammaproteobacteria-8]|nr:MAG: ribosome maturation factor RimP [Gammaproteobacteria bacterium HGW-Gammaproteobacteria-8]